MTGYLDELTERLCALGMAEDRASATVADLAVYLEETGADAEDEFGPVTDFAALLTGPGAAAEPPGKDTEVWRWSAVGNEEPLLNEYGDQGWELIRVDLAGRLVCRRDTENPQRWEYRKEVAFAGERAPVEARLAPDGWELCGTMATALYFKRPRAASLGPAAALSDPPPVPDRSIILTWKFYAFLGLVIAGVIGIAAYETAAEGLSEGLATAAGAVFGGVIGVLAVALPLYAYAAWRNRTTRSADPDDE